MLISWRAPIMWPISCATEYGCGGTLVVHHSKRFFFIGVHPRGQSATRWIIDDQHADIGAVFVAQTMDLVHVAIALVGKAPDVLEVLTVLLDVVRLVRVHKPELDVPEATYAEGFVCLFDGKVDELALDIGIVARCFLGVGDNDVDDDVASCCASVGRRFLRR